MPGTVSRRHEHIWTDEILKTEVIVIGERNILGI